MMARALFCSVLVASVAGHGLIKSPKSRNQICGVEIKPHDADATCAEAFVGDHLGGYQFMGVLTHALGRNEVRPLPENVCGFNSEVHKNGPTPWDKPINWPTNPMKAGRTEFVWDIQWGDHFSDTDEFRYYITKPDFKFEVGTALKWTDFEDTAFCLLKYNDMKNTENPDVIPMYKEQLFKTYCDVPARMGHHVIYAEWGRTQPTLERFHGCVDVEFPSVTAPPTPTPPATPLPSGETARPVVETPAPTKAPTCRQWATCQQDPNCCVPGTKCYMQNQCFGQCLTACPHGWLC